jgi:ribosome-interacting GTPase 1
VLLVFDITADDVEPSAQLLFDVLSRGRVWPRARPLAPDAPPFIALRPVLVLGNKADLDDGTFAELARESLGPDLSFFPVSAVSGAGLDELRPLLFRELKKIRVYSKEPGHKPDLASPFVLPEGSTIQDLATRVHKEIAERMRFARIWGHAKFDGQQVDRHHVLADRDIVELHA